MSMLRALPPAAIEEYWHLADPLFRKLVSQTNDPEFDADDLKGLAKDGRVLIFLIEENGLVIMALAIEFRYYQRFKVLNVLAMAGERTVELFNDHKEFFADFAKSCGAKYFQASGGMVQARLYQRLGFTTAYQTMRYEL